MIPALTSTTTPQLSAGKKRPCELSELVYREDMPPPAKRLRSEDKISAYYERHIQRITNEMELIQQVATFLRDGEANKAIKELLPRFMADPNNSSNYLTPENFFVFIGMADAYKIKKNWTEMYRHANCARKILPQHTAANKLVIIAKKNIAKKVKHLESHMNKAQECQQQGNWQGMLQAAKRAERIDAPYRNIRNAFGQLAYFPQASALARIAKSRIDEQRASLEQEKTQEPTVPPPAVNCDPDSFFA